MGSSRRQVLWHIIFGAADPLARHGRAARARHDGLHPHRCLFLFRQGLLLRVDIDDLFEAVLRLLHRRTLRLRLVYHQNSLSGTQRVPCDSLRGSEVGLVQQLFGGNEIPLLGREWAHELVSLRPEVLALVRRFHYLFLILHLFIFIININPIKYYSYGLLQVA